ncbi:MAG: phospholipid carrier-dependent glycosyltransferase [Vicinamibacterales bacterium]
MPTLSALSRRHLLLAVLAAAIAWTTWFSGAGRLGLIGPDEPRYVSIARAMAESGDWVTPRLNGEPWFEKPVLYYWGAAAAFSIAGESEAAARAPSAIALVLAALALVGLAARQSGGAALALAFVLPSMLAPLAFARAASTDMVFAAMLTLAFAAGARLAELLAAEGDGLGAVGRGREQRTWRLAWGVALGCAVLAKGPAALLLAGASVAAWALLRRRWQLAFSFAHPLSLAAFAAVALPWYVLCAVRNPEFLRVFLFEHNVQRFLTPVFAHEQPWWYFGGVLVAGLLPWTVLLVPAVRDAWRGTAGRATSGAVPLLALCWAVVPFVFFSVSRSKLPGYILPMFPPLAFLIAQSLARALESPGRARGPLAGVGATLLAVGAALALAARALVPELYAPAVEALGVPTWGVAIAATGVGIALLALRRRGWLALGLTATVMALLVVGVTTRIMPALDPLLTSRAAAAAAIREARGGPIYEFGLERTMDFGLDYYLRRDVPEWSPEAGEGVVVVRATTATTFAASGYMVEIAERISPDAVITNVRRLDSVRFLRLN